jgi:psiF repeat
MRTVLILAAAAAMMATGANAQMKPAAAPAATTTTKATHTSSTATTHAGKPRSAESIECSKQADAKGLHGNDRKKFHKSCVKAAKH